MDGEKKNGKDKKRRRRLSRTDDHHDGAASGSGSVAASGSGSADVPENPLVTLYNLATEIITTLQNQTKKRILNDTDSSDEILYFYISKDSSPLIKYCRMLAILIIQLYCFDDITRAIRISALIKFCDIELIKTVIPKSRKHTFNNGYSEIKNLIASGMIPSSNCDAVDVAAQAEMMASEGESARSVPLEAVDASNVAMGSRPAASSVIHSTFMRLQKSDGQQYQAEVWRAKKNMSVVSQDGSDSASIEASSAIEAESAASGQKNTKCEEADSDNNQISRYSTLQRLFSFYKEFKVLQTVSDEESADDLPPPPKSQKAPTRKRRSRSLKKPEQPRSKM